MAQQRYLEAGATDGVALDHQFLAWQDAALRQHTEFADPQEFYLALMSLGEESLVIQEAAPGAIADLTRRCGAARVGTQQQLQQFAQDVQQSLSIIRLPGEGASRAAYQLRCGFHCEHEDGVGGRTWQWTLFEREPDTPVVVSLCEIHYHTLGDDSQDDEAHRNQLTLLLDAEDTPARGLFEKLVQPQPRRPR